MNDFIKENRFFIKNKISDILTENSDSIDAAGNIHLQEGLFGVAADEIVDYFEKLVKEKQI